mmetsp:Transcript_28771/g.62761  ORF Transcript_28771/g.62761 Transcript_28771/m.62761 type:complete len:326 (-) Transcript_28771:276-1253(-)
MAPANFAVAVGFVLTHLGRAQSELPECKRFDAIYRNGQEMCELLWGDAFVYQTDEAAAYTMWFFDARNPNDAVARSLGLLDTGDHEVCGLNYYHKTEPGPEPDTFTECHPWKDNACCKEGTVESVTHLKEGYGEDYHWDRCGPLSQECERFFVQEACFYECDPNAGLYRKFNESVYDARCDSDNPSYDKAYSDQNNCVHNAWEMHKMPIKASYCDAMFAACRADLFCGTGNFFSCAAQYKAADDVAAQKEISMLKEENEKLKESDESSLSGGAIVGIIIPCIIALILLGVSCFLIRQEKLGKPLFARLVDNGGSGFPPQSIGGQA